MVAKNEMKGNIETAENLFKECLKIDPTSAAVKYELGNIYRFNGLYDTALEYGKSCANDEPKMNGISCYTLSVYITNVNIYKQLMCMHV